jgi:hypothetical protein
MKNYQLLIQGFVAGVLLVGCAGLTYQYYGLDLPDGCYKQGKLLAHDPKDDRPFSDCAPDENNKMKCIHMVTSEFQRLRISCDKCFKDLEACQSGV